MLPTLPFRDSSVSCDHTAAAIAVFIPVPLRSLISAFFDDSQRCTACRLKSTRNGGDGLQQLETLHARSRFRRAGIQARTRRLFSHFGGTTACSWRLPDAQIGADLCVIEGNTKKTVRSYWLSRASRRETSTRMRKSMTAS